MSYCDTSTWMEFCENPNCEKCGSHRERPPMTARERARQIANEWHGGFDYTGIHVKDRLARDIERALLDTIEECAKVAERMEWAENESSGAGFPIADEIRKMGVK
ncbi:MAG: hypothetical protein IPI28_19020 [Candidatus Omnitrophica bacterium]|nr:hypothetical protein [Candidatus Omnitrophota bacterium]